MTDIIFFLLLTQGLDCAEILKGCPKRKGKGITRFIVLALIFSSYCHGIKEFIGCMFGLPQELSGAPKLLAGS